MFSSLNRNILQPLHARRNGSRWTTHLPGLRRTQFDPPEVVAQNQWLALRAMLFHAFETVPFYRKRWTALGIHPHDIRSADMLESLPILTKQDLRERADELISDRYRGLPLVRKKTTGSTGIPVEVLVDAASMNWKRACTTRTDEWSGWRQGERVAKVWGNPEYQRQGIKGYLRNLFLDRATYLDTREIDSNRIREFVDTLRRRPPSLLFGHAHSLWLIALWVRQNAPDAFRPRGIISTAMMLSASQRRTIEDAFHTPVTDRYGCEEVSLIASECEVHRGLHVNAESVHVGIDRSAAGLYPQRTGPILVTDLTNFAMPIIRYRTGDVVTLSDEKACDCGRGLPMLENVQGRTADFVVTPAGSLISGISLTENFACLIRGTAQLQIVQESRTHLRLRLVPDATFGEESKTQIAGLVRDTFGPSMTHELEYLGSIAPEKSGKFRFCISPVAEEFVRSNSI